MPTYTYKCTACDETMEKRQSFSDAPLTTCEQCGGALRKVIHPVGIVFKGSGWYITDSRSASSSTVNGQTTSTDSAKKSEPKSADAAPASKESGTSTKDSGASSASSSSPATPGS